MKYVALGIQFEKVDGSAQTISIGDIVSKDGLTANANWSSNMDQIWLMNTNVNEWAFYGFHKTGFSDKNPKWRKCTDRTGNSGKGVFAELTDADVVAPGDTVLFLHANVASPVTLTLAGGVKPFTAQQSYSIAPMAYQFVAYPWPVELKIADIKNYFDANAAANANWSSNMEQIWVMNPDPDANEWNFYGYHKTGFSDKNPKIRKCTDRTGNSGKGVFEECSDADAIPAGQGFLILHANNGKNLGVNFTYPQD